MKDFKPEPKPDTLEEESQEEEYKNEDEDVEKQEEILPEQSEKKPGFSLLANQPRSSDKSDRDSSHVHVVARVRPLNPNETARRDTVAINFTGNGGLYVENQLGAKKSFTFNAVFEPECDQKPVFENCGIQRLLDMALDGYACTAFAFGQTGSGKTYTMTGPVTPESNLVKAQETESLREPSNYGLIQYSFAYLMEAASKKPELTYTIRASYMEIYNEQVQDLLNPHGYDIVQVRWSRSTGFYVENLFVREIDTLDELMEVLENGMKNRSVAEHNMNEHSSRSHSILTVHLDSESMEEQGISVTKRGKISFVDLAGSEKVKETGSTGDTLTEATNINRSLLTLGNCISALSDSKKKIGHIPFRESKLTKLLADSLGGSGATLMVACVTPSSNNVTETLNTLRYAKRAKRIKNKPIIRMDPREELILKLQREMNLIKQENVFLRNQLQFPQREKPRFPVPDPTTQAHQILPQILRRGANDKQHRPGTENGLYDMLQEYMVENEALRNENQSLMTQHSNDEREFRIMSRENDRLREKLEDLQRLVLSSPMVNSAEFSRTTSGHSFLSLRSYDSSLTPISQALNHNQPVFGPNGSNYPNYATTNNNQQQYHYHRNRMLPSYNGNPMPAWEIQQQPITDLPPLRASPPMQKRQMKGFIKYPDSNQLSKWDKGRSYAKQIHSKKVLQKTTNQQQQQNYVSRIKQQDDVMRDFPLRDFPIPRHHENLHGQPSLGNRIVAPHNGNQRNQPMNPAFITSHEGYVPSKYNQEDLFNHNAAGDGLHGMQHHRRENLQQAHGPVLPQEAYRAKDLSPRGTMTKELSATSLRKMNMKMKEEMRALDDQIHRYEKSINNVKAS